MSSAFVPSVERVHLPRNRGGRPPRHGLKRSAPPTPAPTYQLGKRGSAALQAKRSRWGWEWLAADPGVPLKLLEPPKLLFPGTREPPVVQDEFSLDVILASATQYIHDTPDIYEPDVVAQLVAEELTAQHEQRSSAHADHERRRTVAVILHPESRLARTLVCFPTGAVGQTLNISPFLPTTNYRHHAKLQSRFVPSADPVEIFPTTILQVASSPVVSTHRMDSRATALVVRLATSTHLLNVIPNPTFVPPTLEHPVTTLRVGELSVTDTEGRRHVDVELDPSTWSRAAIVDEGGGVWLWWEDKERVDGRTQKIMRLSKVRDAVDESQDGFYEVAFGTRPDTLLVISRTSATVIDIAASPAHAVVIKSNDPPNKFLAIDKTAAARAADFTCICSTKELLWVDDNMGSTPALRWSHDQADDVDILVIPDSFFDEGNEYVSEVVIVYSRNSGLVQAVQLSVDRPARLRALPFSPGGLAIPLFDLSLLPFQNQNEHRGSACIVGAASDGAIHLVKLGDGKGPRVTPKGRPPKARTREKAKAATLPRVKWGGAVEQLSERAPGAPALDDVRNWDSKGEARYEVLSARWAWSSINESETLDHRWHPTSFVQDLRESDTHLEHIMTASERARDFAYGPSNKSNLLRRLEFPDSAKELLAELSDKYPLYFPFACQTGTSLGQNRLDRPSIAVRSGQRRAEAEHTRLELDLTLSASTLWSESITAPTVTSPIDIAPSNTPDDLFAAAAGQLSLEERPTVFDKFRLLHPKTGEIYPIEAAPTDFAAAQPLLNEWTVGDDVGRYRWARSEMWQVNSDSPSTNRIIRPLPSVRASQPNLSSTTTRQSPSPTRLVPPVSAVLTVPSTSSLPPVRSLAAFSSIPHVSRSSPPPGPEDSLGNDFPLTQVERGPFGARPEATRVSRKKATKKRAGGF